MNRHQAVVLGVAAVNIMLMLLFPPYDALGMLRGGQSFDAFYFALDTLPSKVINWDMLQLEVYWVLANAALAWWLLRAPVSSQSGFGIGLYQTSKLAEISGFALTLTRNEAGNVCFTLRGEVRGARAQAPAGASGARQA